LLVYVGTVAGVVLVWFGLSASGAVQPLLLASPADTWRALTVVMSAPDGIWPAVGTTVRETLTAFVIAAALALPVGVLVGSLSILRRAYEPIFTSLSIVPLVVLYPVLAATLGVGSGSKIALGGLYAFFPMVIATVRAAGNVDHRLLTAASAMGASRVQSLTRVVVPLILPPLLASMRVALGLALVTVIAGEFISGSDGVGFELGNASQLLDTPTLFAWVVVACLLTVVVNLGFTLFSNLARKGIYR
jgi:ABC-type nitrate/sulfonate/bicarbonate transport system permease component